MKRLITIILILALALPATAALAEIPDISGLSYDELVELRDKINLAMWKSAEWQEVKVPGGVWEVGVDIPEGYWTVTPDNIIVSFCYCDKLNETGTDVGSGWSLSKGVAITLDGKKDKDGNWKYNDCRHEISIDMKAGMYVVCKGDMIFTPYSGKPDLGFH